MEKGIYLKLLVLVGIVCLSTSCGNKQAKSEFQEESETFSSEENSSYNPNLSRLEEEVMRAKSRFQEEVNQVPIKATRPEFQGVFSQKLFFDADDYFREFEDKVEELARELRKSNLPEIAEDYEEDLRKIRSNYRNVKRQMNNY